METPWMTAGGLAAAAIAITVAIAKLRAHRRASNRLIWRQWRRA
jgi:hypothetical protein